MGLKSNSIFQYSENQKWIILAISLVISISSILFTKILVQHIKSNEKHQTYLLAKAMEYTYNNFDTISFIAEEIIHKNNSVPTIMINGNDKILFHKNIDLDSSLSELERDIILAEELSEMQKSYSPMVISINNPDNGMLMNKHYVYYRNSFLITQLIVFPYIQIVVIAIFGIFSYLLFNYSKFTEQNRLWVGIAKETAHQLGTPLSSLMAWIEIMRDDPYIGGKSLVEELQKDIDKLKIVTERFSSIGSIPTLKEENIFQLINRVVEYLRPRISSKIQIEVFALSETIKVNVNAPLFEWVIENLIKNGVDAIGPNGTIAIKILRGSEGKVFIDVSDNGKGILKSDIYKVFSAGFTTKRRGWGLGLTLTKRIIELYHEGKIFVRKSEKYQGTTFRIEMKSTKWYMS